MSFRVATASYIESKEEVKLRFSKEFENDHPAFKLDCLVDIIHEARLRYNEEVEKYKQTPNAETALALLGLPDVAP